MLPAGPCLHSADFNEDIALKLIRTFVDVCENERLAVKGVKNPVPTGGRGSMTFSSIAVPSAGQDRELHVSKFPARRL